MIDFESSVDDLLKDKSFRQKMLDEMRRAAAIAKCKQEQYLKLISININ